MSGGRAASPVGSSHHRHTHTGSWCFIPWRPRGKKPSGKLLPSLPVQAKTGTDTSHCSQNFPSCPFLVPARCSQGTAKREQQGLEAAAPHTTTSPGSQSFPGGCMALKYPRCIWDFSLSKEDLQVDMSMSYTGNKKGSDLLISESYLGRLDRTGHKVQERIHSPCSCDGAQPFRQSHHFFTLCSLHKVNYSL